MPTTTSSSPDKKEPIHRPVARQGRSFCHRRNGPSAFYGGRASATALSAFGAANDEDLDRLATTATVAGGDESAPKPGDGGARAPGMFLHKLNPYQGLDEAGRKALIEKFRDQEESWGNRDLRLALMDEQGINAAVMFPGIVLTLEVEFQDDVDAIYANTERNRGL